MINTQQELVSPGGEGGGMGEYDSAEILILSLLNLYSIYKSLPWGNYSSLELCVQPLVQNMKKVLDMGTSTGSTRLLEHLKINTIWCIPSNVTAKILH